MQNLLVVDPEIESLLKLSPNERMSLLQDSLKASAEQIVQAAKIVKAMEAAGDDISSIPCSILVLLRKIYGGQVRSAVFIQFDGLLRRKIAALPLQNQDSILNGGKVKVVRLGEKTEIREVDPRSLDPFQIRQVFASDYIRDEAQQVSYLEAHKAQEPKPIDMDALIRIDKKRGRIIISGPIEIPTKELASYLQQLTS